MGTRVYASVLERRKFLKVPIQHVVGLLCVFKHTMGTMSESEKEMAESMHSRLRCFE